MHVLAGTMTLRNALDAAGTALQHLHLFDGTYATGKRGNATPVEMLSTLTSQGFRGSLTVTPTEDMSLWLTNNLNVTHLRYNVLRKDEILGDMSWPNVRHLDVVLNTQSGFFDANHWRRLATNRKSLCFGNLLLLMEAFVPSLRDGNGTGVERLSVLLHEESRKTEALLGNVVNMVRFAARGDCLKELCVAIRITDYGWYPMDKLDILPRLVAHLPRPSERLVLSILGERWEAGSDATAPAIMQLLTVGSHAKNGKWFFVRTFAEFVWRMLVLHPPTAPMVVQIFRDTARWPEEPWTETLYTADFPIEDIQMRLRQNETPPTAEQGTIGRVLRSILIRFFPGSEQHTQIHQILGLLWRFARALMVSIRTTKARPRSRACSTR